MLFHPDKTQLHEDSRHSNLLSDGQTFGHFRVIRLLGRGGMGEVYEVEHRDLSTRHALKLINPEIVDRPDAKERFKREARVMARLRHSNIVHVDDFGELDDRIWLRMDLMEGWSYQGAQYTSLQDLMRKQEALPEELVKRLIGQMLDGLGIAHDSGAVHRDLKPANLLLDGQGTVKITDFGLVSLVGADWLKSQVQLTVARSMADPDVTRLEGGGSSAGTSTQALLGTYAYMSPEQKKGGEVDHRSDLYAVGLIGFQMLTGEETPGFEVPSDLVEGLDPAWDQWVRQSLASRADRRFADARRMKESLPSSATSSSVAPAPVQETDPFAPSLMDQESTNLEERIEKKSDLPLVPEPEEYSHHDISKQKVETSQVQKLNDAGLKQAYNASKNIVQFKWLMVISSIVVFLVGLIILSDGDQGAGLACIIYSAFGIAQFYWSYKRKGWHRTALLLSSAFFLIWSLGSNIVAWYMIYVLINNKNFFGSDRLTHQDLKLEYKHRGLKTGLSLLVKVVLIPFAVLLIFIVIAVIAAALDA